MPPPAGLAKSRARTAEGLVRAVFKTEQRKPFDHLRRLVWATAYVLASVLAELERVGWLDDDRPVMGVDTMRRWAEGETNLELESVWKDLSDAMLNTEVLRHRNYNLSQTYEGRRAWARWAAADATRDLIRTVHRSTIYPGSRGPLSWVGGRFVEALRWAEIAFSMMGEPERAARAKVLGLFRAGLEKE